MLYAVIQHTQTLFRDMVSSGDSLQLVNLSSDDFSARFFACVLVHSSLNLDRFLICFGFF